MDNKNKITPDVTKELLGEDFECPNCGLKFEDEDFAHLLKTGECKYCHCLMHFTVNN